MAELLIEHQSQASQLIRIAEILGLDDLVEIRRVYAIAEPVDVQCFFVAALVRAAWRIGIVDSHFLEALDGSILGRLTDLGFLAGLHLAVLTVRLARDFLAFALAFLALFRRAAVFVLVFPLVVPRLGVEQAGI